VANRNSAPHHHPFSFVHASLAEVAFVAQRPTNRLVGLFCALKICGAAVDRNGLSTQGPLRTQACTLPCPPQSMPGRSVFRRFQAIASQVELLV
jgi:hypothetical protein